MIWIPILFTCAGVVWVFLPVGPPTHEWDFRPLVYLEKIVVAVILCLITWLVWALLT